MTDATAAKEVTKEATNLASQDAPAASDPGSIHEPTTPDYVVLAAYAACGVLLVVLAVIYGPL
jgi:hypothetical protein